MFSITALQAGRGVETNLVRRLFNHVVNSIEEHARLSLPPRPRSTDPYIDLTPCRPYPRVCLPPPTESQIRRQILLSFLNLIDSSEGKDRFCLPRQIESAPPSIRSTRGASSEDFYGQTEVVERPCDDYGFTCLITAHKYGTEALPEPSSTSELNQEDDIRVLQRLPHHFLQNHSDTQMPKLTPIPTELQIKMTTSSSFQSEIVTNAQIGLQPLKHRKIRRGTRGTGYGKVPRPLKVVDPPKSAPSSPPPTMPSSPPSYPLVGDTPATSITGNDGDLVLPANLSRKQKKSARKREQKKAKREEKMLAALIASLGAVQDVEEVVTMAQIEACTEACGADLDEAEAAMAMMELSNGA